MSESHDRIKKFAYDVLRELHAAGKHRYYVRDGEGGRGHSLVIEARKGEPSLLIKGHERLDTLAEVTYRDCPQAHPTMDVGSPVRVADADLVADVLLGGTSAFAVSTDRKLERRSRPF